MIKKLDVILFTQLFTIHKFYTIAITKNKIFVQKFTFIKKLQRLWLLTGITY